MVLTLSVELWCGLHNRTKVAFGAISNELHLLIVICDEKDLLL